MMPSVPQLLIVLVIVVLIFGAKRLKNLGGDLGGAVKGFKDAVKTDEDETRAADADPAKLETDQPAPADSTVVRKTDDQNAA